MPPESGTRPSSQSVSPERMASVRRFRPSSGRKRTPAVIARFLRAPGARVPLLRDRILAFMKARPAFFLLRALAGCLPLAVAVFAGAAGAPRPLVVVGRIETPIHPAAASYLEKLIKGAEADRAAVVVVGLSTPGGLLTSTRVMASTILASKVPVVTYVSPSGASAASAGFFLLLAGDVAAMAPGTNSGAAHPVAGEGQDLPKT